MTSRRMPPVLDLIISVSMTIEGSITAGNFRYGDKADDADSVGVGEYFLTTDALSIGLIDSDGETLVAPMVGVELMLEYRNSFNQPDSKTVTIVSTMQHATRLDIVFSVVGSQPRPGFSSGLSVLYSTVGESVTTTRKLWAAQSDFPARDLINAGSGGLVVIGDSRYVVRRDPIWITGALFTDEAGASRKVQGTSQFPGRQDYLEVLARRVGA